MKSWILFATLLLFVAALPAAQREACWGADKPCPDGQYRDYRGQEQPATCNNNFDSAHKCVCAKATTPLEQCPENNVQMDMSKCSVYCREDACKCVSVCDFNDGK